MIFKQRIIGTRKICLTQKSIPPTIQLGLAQLYASLRFLPTVGINVFLLNTHVCVRYHFLYRYTIQRKPNHVFYNTINIIFHLFRGGRNFTYHSPMLMRNVLLVRNWFPNDLSKNTSHLVQHKTCEVVDLFCVGHSLLRRYSLFKPPMFETTGENNARRTNFPFKNNAKMNAIEREIIIGGFAVG